MIERDWFVDRAFIEEIKTELSDAVGYGPKKFDRDISQALDALDARTLDSLVFILGRVLLLTKRVAQKKGIEEDGAQEREHLERVARDEEYTEQNLLQWARWEREAPHLFNSPPQRVI